MLKFCWCAAGGLLQAIVDTLCAGGAPELISLDLRGNELSEEAQQMLVRPEAGSHDDATQQQSLRSCCIACAATQPGHPYGWACHQGQQLHISRCHAGCHNLSYCMYLSMVCANTACDTWADVTPGTEGKRKVPDNKNEV